MDSKYKKNESDTLSISSAVSQDVWHITYRGDENNLLSYWFSDHYNLKDPRSRHSSIIIVNFLSLIYWAAPHEEIHNSNILPNWD